MNMAILSLLLFYTTLLFTNSLKTSHIPPTDNPPTMRQSLAGTYNWDNRTLYIYGGVKGSTLLDDMWEFNFDTNQWKEIHSPSIFVPGPRSSPFIQILPDAKTILLFGGMNEKGPLSDLWIFNIDNNIVIFTQWTPIFTQDLSPVSSAYNAICAYHHGDGDFIASFGGSSYKGRHNRLTILNLNTLQWSEPEYTGTPPSKVDDAIIQYYKGSLYVFSGISSFKYASNELYRYDIERSNWSLVKTSGVSIPDLYACCGIVIDSYLYILFGFTKTYSISNDIYRINLDEVEPTWEVVDIIEEDDFIQSIPRVNSLLVNMGDKVVMFGGWNTQGVKNDLVILEPADLNNSKLKYRYINKITEVPPARIGHRMEVYQENLLVFGGRDKYKNPLIDIWSFDIKKEIWKPFLTQGYQPTGRSDFCHSKLDNSLFVYGGLGSGGLLGDIYRLNLYNKEWSQLQINSSSKPSTRKGSCMVATQYSLFIFGGITEAGHTNELWEYDLDTGVFKEVIGLGDIPIKLAYTNCRLTRRENEDIIQIFTGETLGSLPSPYIYEFNCNTKLWRKLPVYINLQYSRSKVPSLILNDKMIVAGGQQFNRYARDQIYSLDLNTFQFEIIGSIDFRIYDAGFVYFNDKIYLHGGGASIGDVNLNSVPTNNLYTIQLNHDDSAQWPCSKGFYMNNNECQACPPGTYSEEIGSNCLPCPSGYFSEILNSDSIRNCLPCREGYFNPKEGQSLCIQCTGYMYCPIGSINPIVPYIVDEKVISSQPEVYSANIRSDMLNNINYLLATACLVLIVFVLITGKLKPYIKRIDIFIFLHNHFINKKMYIKKTFIGGLFSVGYVTLVSIFISSFTIGYLYNNISEFKLIVPLVTLEKEYEHIKADEMIFEFSFLNYGGYCVDQNLECVKQLEISQENLIGEFSQPICKDMKHYCSISYICNQCELTNSAKLSLVLKESLSFATEMKVNVTSSSSIPNSYSSTSVFIPGEADKLFRGIEPTKVYLLITPSIYISEVEGDEEERTGYHIFTNEDSENGSLIDINE